MAKHTGFVIGLLLMLFLIPVQGQGGLDWGLPPESGGVDLSAGFVPDPHRMDVRSGGGVDVSYLGNNCVGSASSNPTVNLYWNGQSGGLYIYVQGGGDMTLIVNDASGQWHCDDDSLGDLKPVVYIPNPSEGRYDIWVGSFDPGNQQSVSLFISEVNPLASGVTASGAGSSGNTGAGPVLQIDGSITNPSILAQVLQFRPNLNAIQLQPQSGYGSCTAASGTLDELARREGSARYALAGASGDEVAAMEAIVNNGELLSVAALRQMIFPEGLELGNNSVSLILIDDFSNRPDDGWAGVSHGFVVYDLLKRLLEDSGLLNQSRIEVDGIDINAVYSGDAAASDSASSGQVATALEQVIRNKMERGYSRFVINMSFSIIPCEISRREIVRGTSYSLPPSDPLMTAINDLQEQGIMMLPVAAAGNYGGVRNADPLYPARFPDVISVSGSIGENLYNFWGQSNNGEVMLPAGWYEFQLADQHTYQIGTSFAAPVMSLILAAHLTWTDSLCYLQRRSIEAAAGSISYNNLSIQDWFRCN